MPRILLALALVALVAGSIGSIACHGQVVRDASECVPLQVGETEVELAVHRTGDAGTAFLVLHDNEQTAVEAGLEAIRDGGRLVEVRSRGERLLEARRDGRVWRFDPNRIFTEAGAEATLRAENGDAPPAPPAVVAEVRDFAEALLEAYGAASLPVVVTLHNNSPGQYSAASYAPGGDLVADAAAVHLPVDADPDNFFFVTERGHYEALTASGFPVVLQDNERAADDGSLSIWAARQGIPYVNVEAEHGQRDRQVEMLAALARVLG